MLFRSESEFDIAIISTTISLNMKEVEERVDKIKDSNIRLLTENYNMIYNTYLKDMLIKDNNISINNDTIML